MPRPRPRFAAWLNAVMSLLLDTFMHTWDELGVFT